MLHFLSGCNNAVSGAANISFHSTHFVIMNIVGMSNYNQLENCPWQNGNTHLAHPPPYLVCLGNESVLHTANTAYMLLSADRSVRTLNACVSK